MAFSLCVIASPLGSSSQFSFEGDIKYQYKKMSETSHFSNFQN